MGQSETILGTEKLSAALGLTCDKRGELWVAHNIGLLFHIRIS